MKRPLIIALVVIGAVSAGWLIHQKMSVPGAGKKAGVGRSATVPVVVAPVRATEMADRIEAVGTTKANESIILTAKVTETVRNINFDGGTEVKKGDVLVELTTREVAAQLKAAEAKAHEAQLQYKRIVDLVKRKAASQSRLDQQIGVRDSARAEVEALRARMADRVIRAPFDGITGLRLISPGALVTPGTQITSLDDIHLIKLDFAVPETFLGHLKVGLPVSARSVAFPATLFQGTVKSIDSRINPATRAVTVRAHLPNPERLLKPGMLLTVELTTRQSRVLAVPEEAIVPVGSRQFVFVVADDNTAKRREVKTGRRQPGIIEILSGLKPGERVITEGTIRVRPGIKVKIVRGRETPVKQPPGAGTGPQS